MKLSVMKRVNFIFLLVILGLTVAGTSFGQGKGHDKHGGGGRENGGGKPGGGNGNGKHGGDNENRGGNRGYIYQTQPNAIVIQRGDDRGHGNGKWKQKNEPRQVYVQPQVVPQVIWNGGWPRNYGQQRSSEVHERNAERKALKEQQKAFARQQREYERNVVPNRYYAQPVYPSYQPRQYYPRYSQVQPQYYPQYSPGYTQPRYRTQQVYVNPGYSAGGYYSNQPYYSDAQRVSVKDILRNLVFSVLGANAGLGGGLFDNGYSNGYYPAASYAPYPSYSPYSTSRYTPRYAPVAAYAAPSYAYDPGYGSGYYGNAYDTAGIPFDQVLEINAGDGFTRQVFSELVAVGYEQGFNDGLAARARRSRNAFYDDPYVYDSYDEAIYDPYSVSLGENRRCLSQGYDLGYEDALNNNRSAAGLLGDGNVDLVSVLLSSISSFS